MRDFAGPSLSNSPRARANRPPPAERLPYVSTSSAHDHAAPQGKANCVCGGDCPRCQSGLPVQTKLAVSRPGDSYEQEADRAAEQVMRMPEPGGLLQRPPLVTLGAPPDSLQRKTDAETVTRPSFEDCPAERIALIRQHLEKAQRWVRHTVGRLENIQTNNDKPLADKKLDAALNTHFHMNTVVNKPVLIRELLRDFRDIQAGFAKTPFQCETSCKSKGAGTQGYVLFRSVGDIHLCPCWFDPEDPNDKCYIKGRPLSPDFRAQAIVHEMAHKYANKDDVKVNMSTDGGVDWVEAYEYLHEDAYELMTVHQALQNADNYAAFARDVSKVPPP